MHKLERFFVLLSRQFSAVLLAMKRLVVLISGNGSNLQALLDSTLNTNGLLHGVAEIVQVVSNRRDAFGLQRAEKAGIERLYFPLKPYTDQGKSRSQYDQDLADQIAGCKPDLIVLAGWMHILSKSFLDRFPSQVINLHPALPGQFDGANAIERAWAAFKEGLIAQSGLMVHFVIPEVDRGKVILSQSIELNVYDSFESFKEAVHSNEHVLLVKAVYQVCTSG